MHSALFVMEDASFISRIKEIMNGRFIQCFFVRTEEKALSIMESNEIAVAVISLSLFSPDDSELKELLLQKNERLQIILVFDEADRRRAVYLHNKISVRSLFCSNMISFEELLKQTENALLSYDDDSKLKLKNDAFCENETNYKNRMFEVSTLLNDRMENYRKIIRHFHICGRYLLGMGAKAPNMEYEADILAYQEQILENFVQLYLLREPVVESFFDALRVQFNQPTIQKCCTLTNEVMDEIQGDAFEDIAFLMSILTFYFYQFYSECRGIVTLSQDESFYLLDIRYDVGCNETMKKATADIGALNEKLVSNYAAKASYGKKGCIACYKIYFTKPRKEEG